MGIVRAATSVAIGNSTDMGTATKAEPPSVTILAAIRPSGGTNARLGDETWEPAIVTQLGAVELSDAVVAGVVAALGSDRQPVTIERGRIERSLRDLALQHAAGAISDEAYLARSRELKKSRDQLDAG